MDIGFEREEIAEELARIMRTTSNVDAVDQTSPSCGYTSGRKNPLRMTA
jgi:hypothetical protein